MKYLFAIVLAIALLLVPVTAGSAHAENSLPPAQSLAPSVDPSIGYRVEDLGNEIYVVIGQYDYTCMFAVTEVGVVLFDAPPTMAPILQAAISSKTEQPVTYIRLNRKLPDSVE